MSNGLVVKIYRSYVVALNSDGEFIKIKRGPLDPHIGEVYQGERIEPRDMGKLFKRYKAYIAIASSLIILLSSLFLYLYNHSVTSVYVKEYAEVTIKTNSFNRVIEVEALNKNGDRLLHSVNLKNKSLDEALISLYATSVNINLLDDNFKKNSNIYSINITSSKKSIYITRFINNIKASPYVIHINKDGDVIYNSDYK